jgi:hypothetical protein
MAMAEQSSHMTRHALKQLFENFYLRWVKILNVMDYEKLLLASHAQWPKTLPVCINHPKMC